MGPPDASATRFIDDYLPYLLARASQAVAKEFHAELRRRGITVPVWRVLATLSDSPGETVSSLATASLLQQPTMTKLLDRMERDGLVQRQPDQQDRRIVRIALTPAGQTKAADLMAAAKRYEADVLDRHPQAAGMKDLLRAVIARPNRTQS